MTLQCASFGISVLGEFVQVVIYFWHAFIGCESSVCHVQYRDWSTDGMETVVLSDTRVQCISSHLTTFAVLIDHSGLIENEVK